MFKRVLVVGGLVAFAAACGGGSAPPPETSTANEPAPPPPPEPEAASEPEAEPGADVGDVPERGPVVEMRTTLGDLRIELYPDEAPKTVENFLTYVRDGFYDGTIFHRVVPGFVIQGGGFTPDMTEKETRPPIENEANNGLRNSRGTICMARTPDPHSATSQFFINTVDNPMLDFKEESARGWGYAVFGEVIEGLEVVDAIEKVERTRKGMYDDVPVEPVVIESARIVGEGG